MRGRADFIAELDAAFARTAVRVSELEQLPAGSALIVGLEALRAAPIDTPTSVRVIALWTKSAAWLEASRMVAVNDALCGDSFLDPDLNETMKLVAEEIAAITQVSYPSARNQVDLTFQIARSMPASWVALDRGDLTLAHIKAIAIATASCSPAICQAVDAVVVEHAIACRWTPFELKINTERIVIELDPDGAAERTKAAKDLHDVRYRAGQDETGELNAAGPATSMRPMMDRIEALAAQLGRDGDDRSIGQRRIAAMELLLLGPAVDRPSADVVLTFPLTSALGLTNLPGELSGHGPLTAATCRELMKDATVRRLLTDPITGSMIDLGHTRYRPTVALERILNHRDRTCRFIGCAKPAFKCDKDHVVPYDQGGCTSTDTMQSLCRHHHNLKTRRIWTVHHNPDGSTTCISALGFTYVKPPPRYPIENLVPPDDRDLPDDIEETALPSDPDPPRAEDPLPESPEMTLEEYYQFSDDLDRHCIIGAITNYDAWQAFQRQLETAS